MPKTITVTNMARSFSNVIGEVYYKGETFDIKKGSNIVARLVPAEPKPTRTLKMLQEPIDNGPRFSKEELDEWEKDIAWLKSFKITKKDFEKWDW